MPKKIRELKSILRQAGFACLPKRGKGSHTVWEHPALRYNITLAGQDGEDAQRYQEKDVCKAIRDSKQQQEDNNDSAL